jgi:hypothetical protein
VLAVYDAEGWALLLNLRNGRKVVLEPAMGFVWGLLEQGSELHAAVQALRERLSPSPELDQAIEQAVAELRRAGVLTTRFQVSGPATGLIAHAPTASNRIVADERPLSPVQRFAATAGFAIAIAIIHLPIPFSAQLAIVRGVSRLRRQRPRFELSIGVVAFVRRIARPYLGWVDCYEISLGAFIALALTGNAPDWCWGARFGQLDRHAWLEDAGAAIDHKAVTTDRPYKCVIRITPPHGH